MDNPQYILLCALLGFIGVCVCHCMIYLLKILNYIERVRVFSTPSASERDQIIKNAEQLIEELRERRRGEK